MADQQVTPGGGVRAMPLLGPPAGIDTVGRDRRKFLTACPGLELYPISNFLIV